MMGERNKTILCFLKWFLWRGEREQPIGYWRRVKEESVWGREEWVHPGQGMTPGC